MDTFVFGFAARAECRAEGARHGFRWNELPTFPAVAQPDVPLKEDSGEAVRIPVPKVGLCFFTNRRGFFPHPVAAFNRRVHCAFLVVEVPTAFNPGCMAYLRPDHGPYTEG